MSILRMGIVGIGNIGSVHAVQLYEKRVTDAVLAAICDISGERLQWAEERFGDSVQRYTDYLQMLKSGTIDAVLIATPHILHPVIAQDAFRHNLSVLTEKPAGIDIGSVHKMNLAAEKSGKVFGIMYNQRTNPLYSTLQELIRSGKLGEIKRFVWIINNWYRTQAYYDSGGWRATWNGEGGGVLINQCPHNLDIWQWMMGMPKRVRAFCMTGHYHRINVEDDVTIYAEYENGATAAFITSTGEYPGTNHMEISGTKGKAVIENGVLKLYLLERDEREICFQCKEGMPREKVNCEIIEPSDMGSGHLGILQNFTESVLKGSELIAPGVEGIKGLMLSNAAYLSAWKDDWVTFPLDEKEFAYWINKKQEEEKGSEKVVSRENLPEEYTDRWSVRW